MIKEYIKEIYDEEEHDGFAFTVDEEDNLDIIPFKYVEKYEVIETHELGYKYHILTYKDIDGVMSDPDVFEAIIGNPSHYIGGLVEAGFLGVICKMTSESYKCVTQMYHDMVNLINIQNNNLKGELNA